MNMKALEPTNGTVSDGEIRYEIPENSEEFKRIMSEQKLLARIDEKEKEIIKEQAKQAAEAAVTEVTNQFQDALGRKFFESSVYRNLYDVISELRQKGKTINKILQAGMMQGYGKGGNITSNVTDPSLLKTPSNASIASTQVARFILGHYEKIGGKRLQPVITWLKHYEVLPKKWISAIEGGIDNAYITGHIAQNLNIPPYNKTQLIFQANDIAREAINLERTLNRLHLPMPGDLRDWAFRLRDLVANEQTPHPLRMVVLWHHMYKLNNWLAKIESSIEEAEARSEELKRKQQAAAEQAYTEALKQLRAEYEDKLAKEKEAAKTEAAEKARAEAESKVSDAPVSYEEKEREIKRQVSTAVASTEKAYQERISKLQADLQKAEKDGVSESKNGALLPVAGAGLLLMLLGG